MEAELLERSLNFHGDDLLRALAKNRGSDVLTSVDPRQVNYFDYHRRYKDPKLEDDVKRSKILDFISQKADMLFKKPHLRCSMVQLDTDDDDNYAVMPPLEAFMGVPEKERHKHFLECLRKSDVVIGMIHAKQSIGFIVNLICVDGGPIREIYDLDIKALCPINQALAVSAHENPLDTYQIKDIIRCVVIEVVPEEQKIIVSMKSDFNPHHGELKLGLMSEENLPSHYRKTTKLHGAMYETVLEQSEGFMNPSNVPYMCHMMGLMKMPPSLMRGLHEKEYAKEEYAAALHKAQVAKCALKSVANGIGHFKAGRHVEAFQCLNKALSIDHENVEAFVARGALYANNCKFSSALDDFELALKINPKHHNARKYMVETLVARGREFEDKNDSKSAYNLFCKALQFNPEHKDANEAIRALEAKEKLKKHERETQNNEVKSSTSKKEVDDTKTREKLKQLLKKEMQEKKASRHRGRSSSSSSTTSSSTSSSSSSRSASSRSKSRRRSPGRNGSKTSDRYQTKKSDYKTYKINTREEKNDNSREVKSRDVKLREENEKINYKRTEDLMDFAEKMSKDKGKYFYKDAEPPVSGETSDMNFGDLEARLNSYYKKFDTTISSESERRDDKRHAKTVIRPTRRAEELDSSGRSLSPKVTFIMKADQMETIGKRYLNKLPPKDINTEDTQLGQAYKTVKENERTPGFINNFKPLKLGERKTLPPTNVFSTLEKPATDEAKKQDDANEKKKLFLPSKKPYRSRYSRSRSRSRSRRSDSRSRFSRKSSRRSRSSSRHLRSYSRSSSSRSSRSSRSRSRSYSYSSRSRSRSRSRSSRNRRSSHSSYYRSRSRSPRRHGSRSRSQDRHSTSHRPYAERAPRGRAHFRGSGEHRGSFEGRPPFRGRGRARPFTRGRGRGRGRGSDSVGIVTRAPNRVPYNKSGSEVVDSDDELAHASTPERKIEVIDLEGSSSGEKKEFKKLEDVENMLKQHKAQKKAESLATNKDIKKKSIWHY